MKFLGNVSYNAFELRRFTSVWTRVTSFRMFRNVDYLLEFALNKLKSGIPYLYAFIIQTRPVYLWLNRVEIKYRNVEKVGYNIREKKIIHNRIDKCERKIRARMKAAKLKYNNYTLREYPLRPHESTRTSLP